MNQLIDARKPAKLSVRLTSDLDKQLADFKRQTGFSEGRLVREGIVLALEKYRPLMAQTEA